jgi:hypothetical protein
LKLSFGISTTNLGGLKMKKNEALKFEWLVNHSIAELNNYLYKETEKFVYEDRKAKDLVIYLGEQERDFIFYNSHNLSEDAVILRQGKSYLYGMLVVPVDLDSYIHIALNINVE